VKICGSWLGSGSLVLQGQYAILDAFTLQLGWVRFVMFLKEVSNTVS